jgi:hypothetical protein
VQIPATNETRKRCNGSNGNFSEPATSRKRDRSGAAQQQHQRS